MGVSTAVYVSDGHGLVHRAFATARATLCLRPLEGMLDGIRVGQACATCAQLVPRVSRKFSVAERARWSSLSTAAQRARLHGDEGLAAVVWHDDEKRAA